MAELTSKAVSAKIKGPAGRFADGNGLYLVVPKIGRSDWMLRYTSNGKRKEMTLGRVEDLSLADARVEAALKMKQLREGRDRRIAKKRAEYSSIQCVDGVSAGWHAGSGQGMKDA